VTAAERIQQAAEKIPDRGYAMVSATDVVSVGKDSADPRVKALVTGAQNCVAGVIEALQSVGQDAPPDGDPRYDVYQLAGELRYMLATCTSEGAKGAVAQ